MLALKHEGKFSVGQPYLGGITVEATVLEELKGPKIIVRVFSPNCVLRLPAAVAPASLGRLHMLAPAERGHIGSLATRQRWRAGCCAARISISVGGQPWRRYRRCIVRS